MNAATSTRWRSWPGTIRVKILAAFCALSAITAILGWSAVRSIDTTGSLVVETYDKPLMSINHARAALSSLYALKVAAGEGGGLAAAEVRERVNDLVRDLELVGERALSDNAAAAVRDATTAVRRWEELLVALMAEPDAATRQRLAEAEQDALDELDLLIEFTAGDGFLRRQAALAEIESARRLSVASTLAALALAAVVAFLLGRQILGPVAAGSAVARRIAAGDLDVEVPVSGKDELGTMLQAMARMRDNIRTMVERERAQRHSAQARLVDALENSAEGFVLVDAERRIVVANSRIAAMLGCPAPMLAAGAAFEALLRMAIGCGLTIAGREVQEPEVVLAALLDSAEPLEVRLPTGRWARVVRSATHDGGFVATWSDIGEIKEREQALRAARDRAEAASRAKSEFLANMSHELRTPLNAVIGFSEMMHEEVLGPLGQPKYKEFARDVLLSGKHLLGIINDILELAKSEAGRLQVEPKPVPAGALFEDCRRIVEPEVEARGLTLAVELPAAPLTVRIDPLKGRQILLNLLSNALKFTPTGGTVRLVASADAAGVCLAVIDTGIGMRAEDIPVALTPFGQVESSLNRKYEGTGLGLPLTKTLVELHGGTLTIESAPGRGTAVTIRLPHALSAAAA